MLTLENSANNFERGRTDEFVMQTRNLGRGLHSSTFQLNLSRLCH
jgi:hypothetical protein